MVGIIPLWFDAINGADLYCVCIRLYCYVSGMNGNVNGDRSDSELHFSNASLFPYGKTRTVKKSQKASRVKCDEGFARRANAISNRWMMGIPAPRFVSSASQK